MATNDTVLLTGATGFVGFRVLLDLLRAGHTVRAAVRSDAKMKTLLANRALIALGPAASSPRLTFIVVPDMMAPSAYDEAAKGVRYVVHVASQIPSLGREAPTPEQFDEQLIKAPVAGDVGMLESARKAGTVKRVVLTSSCVAIVSSDYHLGLVKDYSTQFDEKSRTPGKPGPFDIEFEAYINGKAHALNAAETWMRREKPDFDLITIMPGFIFGRNELATKATDLTVGGTNSALLSLLLGNKNAIPYEGNAVLVDDVAKVHTLALGLQGRENRSFTAMTKITWEDAIAIAQKLFPGAVEDGRLSKEGKQPTVEILISSQMTEQTFGLNLAPYEHMVKDVVDQYLELITQAENK